MRSHSRPRLEVCALALLVAASGCDAKTRSFFAPPTGSGGLVPAGLTGRVTLDDVGIDRVRVSLDPTGRVTRSDPTGLYAFIPVPPGAYTIRLSNLPPAAFCPETEKPAEVASGDLVVVDFPCFTAGAVAGVLTLDGSPLDSVPIVISGPVNDSTVTDSLGGYGFRGLPPGDYDVTPGPLPPGAVCIPPTQTVSVGAGETLTVAFTCTVLGDVTGTVTLDGAPFGGVGVRLAGTADRSTTTGSDGEFAFLGVPAGAVAVSLSAIPGEVTCSPARRPATVVAAQTVNMTFRCATAGAAPAFPPPPPGPPIGYEFGFQPGAGVCGPSLPAGEAGTVSVTPTGLVISAAHLSAPVTGSFDPATGRFVGSTGWVATASGFPFPVETSEDWDVTFQSDASGLGSLSGTLTLSIRNASTGTQVCQTVYQVTGTAT